jgi:hypothetical protein
MWLIETGKPKCPPEQRLAGLSEQERQELLKLLTETTPTKQTEAQAAENKDSEPS